MNIFFGAGRLGKKYYAFWKRCGVVVDYFMDNDPALWYKRIEGLKVIPPEKLKDFAEEINILITCRNWRPIWLQLRELGVQDYQIKRCDSVTMLELWDYSSFFSLMKMPENAELSPHDVLFGLDCGVGLGGVQSWSLNTVKELRKLGWNAGVLLHNEARADMNGRADKHTIKAIYADGSTVWEKFSLITDSMLQYRNIICNFPGDNLIAAVLIKKRFPKQYRIIAVIHCDWEEYYLGFMDAEPYLDKCLIISDKIGSEMVKRGFPKEKLIYLPWKIPCNEKFSHCYSRQNEPLRIGFAGRVVAFNKRADLLLEVAKKLAEREIDFKMEIAGIGVYEEELHQQIQIAGLKNKVSCLGMLVDTSPFWFKQDVMISCSECEGHSISQCEAMAAGAVPVVTDTSGVRDDVEDGVNGFIVNIGDIDQMVERLCFLYSNRERLPELGKNAHETILKRNQSFDIQKLWESILLR